MLRIRLTRTGKKKQPNYRIVVAEHSAPIQGKFIEIVGNYNPFTKKIILEKEEVISWLNKGAKPTNTVAKLLKREGLKHDLIVIKEFKAKSKAQIETEKKEKEAEKVKEQADKEAKKIEFEKEQAKIKVEKEAEAKNTENQAATPPKEEDKAPSAPAEANKGQAEKK